MHTEGAAFKYDLFLNNVQDVERIKLRYTGPDRMTLLQDGSLEIGTSVGDLTEGAPVAYYADGKQERVECRYVVEDQTVSFAFDGAVDPLRPIVIDPVILAATYSGTGDIGWTENYGGSATYGADGSIFTGAHCFSQGYPTTPGAFQLNFPGGPYSMAISKLSADGTALLWATYLGGDGNDTPASMIEAADGSLVIMGTSNSENYPCSPDAFDDTWGGGLIERDIVISRLSADGADLLASTYVGGSDDDGWNGVQENVGDHVVGEVVLDDSGDVYVCNATWSTNFPTTTGAIQTASAGAQDAVVFKMSADLSALMWSTRLGGELNDVAYGLHLDGSGGVFVVGSTGDGNMPFPGIGHQPAFAGTRDGFVAHIVDNGTSLAGSTYFGGEDLDQLQRVDLDAQGKVHLLGQHASLITVQPTGTFSTGNSGVVVARFSEDLATLEMSTCIASGYAPSAFRVDQCGRVYTSGYLPSSDIPVTSDAVQSNPVGYYVGVYDTGLSSQLFGTYFGLDGDHQDAGMSRFNEEGVLFQALCEDGWPGPFPTTVNAWSTTPAESFDVLAFILDTELGSAEVTASFTQVTADTCAPMTWSLSSIGTADSWVWDFGDGTAATTGADPTHTYLTQGSYTITLIASSSNDCVASDTALAMIDVPECVLVVPEEIVVPNVFSPNGDGTNDHFHISGLEGVDHQLRIFNRWGQVIFDSSNYKNNWDGGGVSDGTYYYVLQLPARASTMTGYLTIL
ncbi:MAG: gliding motility-associated C-terminal domain-containing protein [Flavobacteriales bacterium]|nr:MAG: gliding motility-associated C-terminal domain-containing protein [Flavobacteriales bacterium]